MGALTVDRIRFPLAKTGIGQDSLTGQPPSFFVGTDIQFELSDEIGGVLTDDSDLATVTLAIKLASDEDSAAIISATVTPASTGWNGNPVMDAGTNAVPGYAQYSVGGSYSLGVQLGASYTWTRGANDLTLSNNGTNVTPGNLVPTGHNYAAGSYSITGLLTAVAFYQWLPGTAYDTGINGATPATGFFLATGTDTLNGSGTNAVTAQVYPAALGSNIVPGASTYPTTATLIATGSNLVPGAAAYVAAIAPAIYGSYTLTGLTLGTTYVYTLGANEGPGTGATVNGMTAATGYFTATTISIVLTGIPSATIKTTIYATTQATQSATLNVVSGQTYYFVRNTDATVNGSTSATGFFTATSNQITLTGPGSAAVTATVQQVSQVTTGTFIAAANTVTFTGTASASVTAQLIGSVGWNQGTDQLCVIPFAASQTKLSTPDGGQTAYWMLVTATTLAGKALVLGAGPVNAVDAGQATGVPATNNIAVYPQVGGIGLSAATYDGSGNVTLTLVAGYNYFWTKGAHDLTAPGLSASGTFTTSSSTVVLTGTPAATVTATVYAVNTKPLTMIVPLDANNGTNTFTVTGLALPFTPTWATADVGLPNSSGTPLTAWVDLSTLTTAGATFYLQTNLPATGYKAKVTFL